MQVKRNFSPPPATHRLVLGSSRSTSAVLQPSHSVGQPKPAGRETPVTKRIFEHCYETRAALSPSQDQHEQPALFLINLP